ncbi:hypothetical protein BH18ACT14_BH18ACT14_15830 [soil metagenome]
MSRDDPNAVGWPVVVLPYDARWPELFTAERDRLAGIFGVRAAGIEHVGSTAVSGLAAKGIVDILVGLRPLELRSEDLDAMARLGYVHRGELGIPGRHFFQKSEPPTHHVHAVEHGSVEWLKHVHFRDHLRTHPEDARSYAKLKHDLAVRFPDDRDAYTEGKSPFVAAVLRKASRGSGTPARG